jgi:hypothetical protein
MQNHKDVNVYHYVFHFSPFRDEDKQWACIYREDQKEYWNGLTHKPNGAPVKISYASSTEEAFKNMISK